MGVEKGIRLRRDTPTRPPERFDSINAAMLEPMRGVLMSHGFNRFIGTVKYSRALEATLVFTIDAFNWLGVYSRAAFGGGKDESRRGADVVGALRTENQGLEHLVMMDATVSKDKKTIDGKLRKIAQKPLGTLTDTEAIALSSLYKRPAESIEQRHEHEIHRLSCPRVILGLSRSSVDAVLQLTRGSAQELLAHPLQLRIIEELYVQACRILKLTEAGSYTNSETVKKVYESFLADVTHLYHERLRVVSSQHADPFSVFTEDPVYLAIVARSLPQEGFVLIKQLQEANRGYLATSPKIVQAFPLIQHDDDDQTTS